MTERLHSDETASLREAGAEAIIVLSQDAYAAALDTGTGDVLAAARIAGIMAAKKTSDLIPLRQAIALSDANVAFEPLPDRYAIRIVATAKTAGAAGVETEVLTAASVAALTICDMVKTVDRTAQIESIRLVAEAGGKSGSDKAGQGKDKPSIATRLAIARAKPAALMGEVAAPRAAAPSSRREAFRAFMTGNGLRASSWAKQAGISQSLIFSFLTGKSPTLPAEAAAKLARAANVRVEDMFR
jgi:cyclic pyranopterin phosphate synthase